MTWTKDAATATPSFAAKPTSYAVCNTCSEGEGLVPIRRDRANLQQQHQNHRELLLLSKGIGQPPAAIKEEQSPMIQ